MATTKWVLDPTHSELQFKVKHLMITTVTGSFTKFTAELETEGDNFETGRASFQAEVSSVHTGNTDRDNHLITGDFFDAAEYPTLSFESTSLVKNGDDYLLNGNLTIKGVTKLVTLNVEFGGTAVDPWGNTKAGFTISGKIKRSDWGLTYNAALETGGMMLSDDVRLVGELQFVKQV
jgi:polyisoprenoid-binding protein YceI